LRYGTQVEVHSTASAAGEEEEERKNERKKERKELHLCQNLETLTWQMGNKRSCVLAIPKPCPEQISSIFVSS